ncbi:MAG TPA: GYD domain-containing protein [Chloroflexota bacterium]|nr:GYD domain-containing protein [Chloroflexota bacterium]
MATYIVLYNYTDEGLKNVKGTVQRAQEARASNEQRGFQIKGLYWTQGRYDVVAIVEAPDEAAMMAGLLNVVGAGNVRSETMHAFSDSEMQNIINQM